MAEKQCITVTPSLLGLQASLPVQEAAPIQIKLSTESWRNAEILYGGEPGRLAALADLYGYVAWHPPLLVLAVRGFVHPGDPAPALSISRH